MTKYCSASTRKRFLKAYHSGMLKKRYEKKWYKFSLTELLKQFGVCYYTAKKWIKDDM